MSRTLEIFVHTRPISVRCNKSEAGTTYYEAKAK